MSQISVTKKKKSKLPNTDKEIIESIERGLQDIIHGRIEEV